jgi:hypothetical protein
MPTSCSLGDLVADCQREFVYGSKCADEVYVGFHAPLNQTPSEKRGVS